MWHLEKRSAILRYGLLQIQRISWLTIGLAVAIALARMFSATIPIVPIFRPGPYALATTIVLTATVVAALLPSLRTAKIDPSSALRVE
jgi:ABC-type antimicrobial peptide transport system permease subunit